MEKHGRVSKRMDCECKELMRMVQAVRCKIKVVVVSDGIFPRVVPPSQLSYPKTAPPSGTSFALDLADRLIALHRSRCCIRKRGPQLYTVSRDKQCR